jgi:hypothetical protein
VLSVTGATLRGSPALVRATVAALARGYEEVLTDPENGVSSLLGATTGLKRNRVHASSTRCRRRSPPAPARSASSIRSD